MYKVYTDQRCVTVNEKSKNNFPPYTTNSNAQKQHY